MNTQPGPALRALCERAGVAIRYRDFWGHEQDVPAEALRDLLAALGLDARDEDAAQRSLQALEAARTAEVLPPVVVAQAGTQVAVPLQAPGHDVRWTLQVEDGGVLEGTAEADGVGHAIRLPADLPQGYHTLLAAGACSRVIVCPAACHLPPALAAGERLWGLCVQVYALRSSRNWGMGDFSDLAQLVEVTAALGGAFVGVNPLHALFMHAPEHASPYSPSSRRWLNPLYLDVEALPEYAECEAARRQVAAPAFRQRLRQLREAELVDYAGVAACKREVLETLYRHFRAQHLAADTDSARAFRRFRSEQGHDLHCHALLEAVQAHLHAQDASVWGWAAWPEAWRDPHGAAIRGFEAAHAERVDFHAWLQWHAALQLEAVQQRALALDMPIGLYRDLAVGASAGGSETWSAPWVYALGVHVGAPPEDAYPGGQDWGLPPVRPEALRARGHAPFITTLRANMRAAGALRLDHVMALMRLFWIHPAHGGRHGTYVHYPMHELMGIVALESQRQHCLVIGEDLGNVAPDVRDAMARRRLLSYRPLYFERDDAGLVRPPRQWPARALAVIGTHDLPTLRGWWLGRDIADRRRLGLYPEETTCRRHVVERAADRARLQLALQAEGLQPAEPAAAPLPADIDAGFSARVHEFLGRTAAQLVGVQLEDVLLQVEQPNLPGTNEQQWPNWRRKLAVDLEDLRADPRLREVAEALQRSRARPAAEPVPAALPTLDTARVPRATYRVQLHAGFTFDDATAVLPYLHALGVSHLYSSPFLKARAGSTHGYDIVDHNALNPEIGDAAAFERLCATLAELDMHQVADVVPNHMGVLEADNAWWLDVLEHGPASLHAQTFDIDWTPRSPGRPPQVLLPVLGAPYGEVLEDGQIRLAFDAARGAFGLQYHDHRFPLDPRDYGRVLHAAPLPAAQDPGQTTVTLELQSLADAFDALPSRDDGDPASRQRRQRDQALLKARLAALAARHPWVCRWVDACLRALNGRPGAARSFDALDALIQRQAYRLAYWRVAGDEVNYRRFFDVNTLAAVRMESDAVFDATHRTLLRWLYEGKLAGLRIDHPDGLSDPLRYFARLQARHAAMHQRALYLVIEKILAEHEHWPQSWPVHGDTGYRFANQAVGLFVDGQQEAAMSALYAGFTGEHAPYEDILHAAKHAVMSGPLAADLQMLTEAAYRLAQGDRRTRDFTRNGLKAALAELAAGFPVYRTYLTEDAVHDLDRQHLDWAVAAAKRQTQGCDPLALDYLRALMLSLPGEPPGARREELLRFVQRFQQFTAPVMAKAMEDTAFYRYHRLVCLNDVGGEPQRFGTSVAAFHAANQARARFLPHTLLGSSTHDSKRSEDVRTRIAVLSEMPQAWGEAVQRWHTLAHKQLGNLDGGRLPALNDEYLLYQTLVGAWPLEPPDAPALDAFRARLQAYMLKAAREAKAHTSWEHPDADYEAGLARFIDTLLGQLEPNPFLNDFLRFVEVPAQLGCYNSLALVALKLTSPGVPDLYQGCETWNFSLVDPDNRRPVDYAALRGRLQEVQAACAGGALPRETLAGWRAGLATGHLKLLVTWRLLQLRRAQAALFRDGGYQPVSVDGPCAEHVVAHVRSDASLHCVTVAARLLHRLCAGRPAGLFGGGGWGEARLPVPVGPAGWIDVLTGHRHAGVPGEDGLRLSALLAELPVAVLVPAGAAG
ncbi:malto-oligosyltrehalose synthase [Caldimonas thermodepolymerans]|uniref:4-alpha-glucanotransferase n=1 Tax=Caldimonas thermodepolymerans TaxID=215580 RepID=A0AA46DH09_9BURK|nr:malto-oligosyltrehalose synthase [Caldimonas thermodepolymerans]TCP10000.1 maltooligosyl trehalose synthase [Caldimonas thermodepolymerans]UZG46382.1 malto-oligosyltrehalose synthase [Caldimonas thermodepolymerans]